MGNVLSEEGSPGGVGAGARVPLASSPGEGREGRRAARGRPAWPRKVRVLETKGEGGGAGLRSHKPAALRNWLNPFHKELGGLFSP